MSNEFSLDMLKSGHTAEVSDIDIDGLHRRRLQDLGIVNGTTVEMLFKSPYGDPTAYCIRGCVLAIRQEDAKRITVKKQSI